MGNKGNRFKDRTGELNTNFQRLEMKIVEYRKAIDITVEFQDGTIVKKTTYRDFMEGSIKNLNHPSIFEKGFMGQGNYKAWGGSKLTREYNTWFGMLGRCYNEKDRHKQPTYKGVTVCEEWLNFQNFAKWFEGNYVENYHLDKDIVLKGSRIYSPETCVFVPREINMLFTNNGQSKRNLPRGVYYLRGRFQVSTPTKEGSTYIGFYKTVEEALSVYKKAKEKYMQQVAEEWKDKIDFRVYKALYNYKVEIVY